MPKYCQTHQTFNCPCQNGKDDDLNSILGEIGRMKNFNQRNLLSSIPSQIPNEMLNPNDRFTDFLIGLLGRAIRVSNVSIIQPSPSGGYVKAEFSSNELRRLGACGCYLDEGDEKYQCNACHSPVCGEEGHSFICRCGKRVCIKCVSWPPSGEPKFCPKCFPGFFERLIGRFK